jgi:hypothetical protein
MTSWSKNTGIWTRVSIFVLAVLLAVFLTQVATHIHQDGQNETSCQVCQAAHLSSILPSATLLLVFVAPQTVGYVKAFVVAYHSEVFVHDSPSRAPPLEALQ